MAGRPGRVEYFGWSEVLGAAFGGMGLGERVAETVVMDIVSILALLAMLWVGADGVVRILSEGEHSVVEWLRSYNKDDSE